VGPRRQVLESDESGRSVASTRGKGNSEVRHCLATGSARSDMASTWTTCEGQTVLGRLQMNRNWADPGCTARWMLHFAVDPQI
jgi:hypothetical protein